MSTNPEYTYTLPIEVRLSRRIETAEEGNKLAAMFEEIIENGLRGEGDIADLSPLASVRVSEPICRHPQEGTIRHMSMDK